VKVEFVQFLITSYHTLSQLNTPYHSLSQIPRNTNI